MSDTRERELERRAQAGDDQARKQLLAIRSKAANAYPRLLARWEALPTRSEQKERVKRLLLTEAHDEEQRRRLIAGRAAKVYSREVMRRHAAMILEEAQWGAWAETEWRAHRMIDPAQDDEWTAFGREALAILEEIA